MRAGVDLGGRTVEIAVDQPALVHTSGEYAGNVELFLSFDQRLSGRDRRSLRMLLRLRGPGDRAGSSLLAYHDTEQGMQVAFHCPNLVGAELPRSLELRWGPEGESGLGEVACLAADDAPPPGGSARIQDAQGSTTTIDPRPITPSGCLGALLVLFLATAAIACAAF